MPRAVQNLLLNVSIFLVIAVGPAWLVGEVMAGQTPPAPSAEIQKDIEVRALKAQLTQAVKQISDLQAAIGACQAQLGPLQLGQNQTALDADAKAIIEKYETANPGFTLDPSTWKPVKKPEPVTKPKG